jgi:hypothetical protein
MAMLAFGLAGVLVAGIVAVALVLGGLATRDLDDRLAADQARIGASLTRLSVTMESLAITTRNAGATLETSGQSVADAQVVLHQTADTLVSLAAALDVTILGSRPFGGASEQMTVLARKVSAFETKAVTLAANLHQNATDAGVVTDQVRTLKGDVNELASRIASFDRIGEMVGLLTGGILLAALLTAWVATAAGFCAWAGWRLRKLGAADRTTGSGARSRPARGPADPGPADPGPSAG